MHGVVESREIIEKLLEETKRIIESDTFDINRNFFLKEVRSSDNPLHPKNLETMLALGYDTSDILEEIRTLTVDQYWQTVPDVMTGMPPFYIFVKDIRSQQVYIKYKIKHLREKIIFCISFHFSEHRIEAASMPYKSK